MLVVEKGGAGAGAGAWSLEDVAQELLSLATSLLQVGQNDRIHVLQPQVATRNIEQIGIVSFLSLLHDCLSLMSVSA